jgi:hypothetical protein
VPPVALLHEMCTLVDTLYVGGQVSATGTGSVTASAGLTVGGNLESGGTSPGGIVTSGGTLTSSTSWGTTGNVDAVVGGSMLITTSATTQAGVSVAAPAGYTGTLISGVSASTSSTLLQLQADGANVLSVRGGTC